MREIDDFSWAIGNFFLLSRLALLFYEQLREDGRKWDFFLENFKKKI
jgi:hypothetical protein